MIDVIVASTFANTILLLVGGSAGLTVFSTCWSAYTNWQQNVEAERQTELLILLSTLVLLRGRR